MKDGNMYSLSTHCVKSVQMRSYFWPVFSCIRTEYGPEITPYLDTFHVVTGLVSVYDKDPVNCDQTEIIGARV